MSDRNLKQHPLVGWGLLTHTFEDGKAIINWQGEVRMVLGEIMIVDWFDWMMGDYTYSTGVPISRLTIPYGEDGFIKMFVTAKERNDYYDAQYQKLKSIAIGEREAKASP